MNILDKVEKHVTELFQKKVPETLTFHKINHTKEVVEASRLIGKKSQISEDDMEVLLISAWFHDVGYLTSYSNHENESIKYSSAFLSSMGYDNEKIEKINSSIAATKIPQKPTNIIEAALCDADMFHLSQEDFLEKTMSMRKELNSSTNNKQSKIEYYISTIDFFNVHEYKTEYGRNVLSKGKDKNKELLMNLLEKKKMDKNKKEKKKDKKKHPKIEILKSPTRGVESMFRLTARNQISLSSIADNKANILITVNAIIISVIITMLVGKFNDYPLIIIPTLIFMITSLVTIIFAILTTRPKISSGKFTKEDIKNKKVNLLFFGNFFNMEFEDYEWAIKEIMQDYDGLYGNMIKDQYFLGLILAKKYKRLRIAYNIFMIGITLTVLVFLLTFILYS